MLHHLSTFIINRSALAIGIIFALVGAIFGTWAASIPFIKSKFGLDEAELGLLLLMIPLGAGTMNPFCVPLIKKLGMAYATLISLVFNALFLVIPINMPSLWLAGATLFLFGMTYSAVNISMNTYASQLELELGKNIMATCHGLWSGGAMIGSAVVGLVQSFGSNPQQYVLGVAVFALWMGWWQKKALAKLPDSPTTDATTKTGKALLQPNKALRLLIVIGLCTYLAEGTMADWSAVYVKEVMGASSSMASWGFATYAFFMMTGRLLGDGLIANFGSKRVLFRCCILMTIGYIVAVFAPTLPILFIGLTMIGFGVSLGSPILYTAAAQVPGLPKGAGLAVFNTYAMVGFLGGPVFIGFLAKAFSLPIAFCVVAFFGAIAVLQVRRLR